MTMLLKTWTPDDVQRAADPSKAFCEYVQQIIGVPYPTGKDIAVVRKKAKDFFGQYPHCDWRTLCRVAQWCKSRKKRPARTYTVIEMFRDAWAAGYLPELNRDRREADVEAGIAEALAVEDREGWRRRLVMARSPEIRRRVYFEWRSDRQSLSAFH